MKTQIIKGKDFIDIKSKDHVVRFYLPGGTESHYSVSLDRTVKIDFDSRRLAKQFLKHILKIIDSEN